MERQIQSANGICLKILKGNISNLAGLLPYYFSYIFSLFRIPQKTSSRWMQASIPLHCQVDWRSNVWSRFFLLALLCHSRLFLSFLFGWPAIVVGHNRLLDGREKATDSQWSKIGPVTAVATVYLSKRWCGWTGGRLAGTAESDHHQQAISGVGRVKTFRLLVPLGWAPTVRWPSSPTKDYH